MYRKNSKSLARLVKVSWSTHEENNIWQLILLPTQRYQTETMDEDHETHEINEMTLLHAQRHKAEKRNEGIRT